MGRHRTEHLHPIERLHLIEHLHRIERLHPIEHQQPIDHLHPIDQHRRVHLIGHLHLDRWDRRVLLQVQVAQAQQGRLQVEAEEVEEDTNFFKL